MSLPISPISSRNSVPSSACSKQPGRRVASVKAPRSEPNSSVSMMVGAMAPQLIATQGRSARGELACRLRATTSLPTPLSPDTTTGALAGAYRATSSRTRCICGLEPIRSSMAAAAGRRPISTACRRVPRSLSSASGLIR